MADNLSPQDRRKTMQSVKSKGTSIERKLWAFLAGSRVRGWKKNARDVLGNPDVVFLKYKLAIFIDGCFWHGHNCRNVTPSINSEYWKKKIERNKNRDQVVVNELTQKGWKVVRIWECEVKKKKYRKLLITDLSTLKIK